MAGAGGGVQHLLRKLAVGGSVLVGALYTVGAVAGSIHRRNSALKRKYGKPCGVCKGRGYYTFKLCKAKGTIQWSPLHDPLVIHSCVCPTCEGNKVLKCLNCLRFGLV